MAANSAKFALAQIDERQGKLADAHESLRRHRALQSQQLAGFGSRAARDGIENEAAIRFAFHRPGGSVQAKPLSHEAHHHRHGLRRPGHRHLLCRSRPSGRVRGQRRGQGQTAPVRRHPDLRAGPRRTGEEKRRRRTACVHQQHRRRRPKIRRDFHRRADAAAAGRFGGSELHRKSRARHRRRHDRLQDRRGQKHRAGQNRRKGRRNHQTLLPGQGGLRRGQQSRVSARRLCRRRFDEARPRRHRRPLPAARSPR